MNETPPSFRRRKAEYFGRRSNDSAAPGGGDALETPDLAKPNGGMRALFVAGLLLIVAVVLYAAGRAWL